MKATGSVKETDRTWALRTNDGLNSSNINCSCMCLKAGNLRMEENGGRL